MTRAAVLVAGATAAAYLYRTDPHRPGQLLPRCPFHALTGLLCPFCGATRMAYDVMHGHPDAAWHDNALLLLASPFAALLFARWLAEGLRGRTWYPAPRRRTVAALVATALAWTVVRNAF